MEYTQEDIKQLKSKAEIGEHSAQIELGKYYLENNFSNSNLSNGENYLRLAANKHNEEATYLLIALYLKYIKYFIENAKGSTRIRTYIRECDKWIKIAFNNGFVEIASQKEELLKLIELCDIKAPKVLHNTKLEKKFKMLNYYSCSVLIILFIISIIFLILSKPAVYSITSIFFLLLFFIVLILNATKNKYFSSTVSLSSNISFNNEPVEKNDSFQVGYLGEMYIDYMIKRRNGYILSQINNIVNKLTNKEIKNIKWINEITETTDPYDFVITLTDDSTIYMDVKTSRIPGNPKIYVSDIEKNFASKMKENGSQYIICKITNFSLEIVENFKEAQQRKVSVRMFDLNNENDVQNMNIIFHERNKKN